MSADLPSMTDYRETIEKDPGSFLDEELKKGKKPSGLETGTDTIFYAYGYPGDSGVVYFLRCPGNKLYAIKCFVLRRPDFRHLDAIQQYIEQNSTSFLPSGFRFLPEGIKIGGKTFPIVQMDWIEGVRLDKYIEKNLSDTSRMLSLSDMWLNLSHEMRKLEICHGNLEPANILLERNKLTLVDLDTAFLPTLDGANSPELGHRNYQHPGRKVFHFGNYVDNFSDWIIYSSISALSIDPKLWRFARMGQHLLFQKSDYERPEESEIISTLKLHEDKRLKQMAEWIINMLEMRVEEIPPLNRDRIQSALDFLA